MKVKIIHVPKCGSLVDEFEQLEAKTNEFIKDKDVVSIEWDGKGYRFIVVYDEVKG